MSTIDKPSDQAFLNDPKAVPYRHPQPRECAPELVIPDAIPLDERV